MNTNKNRRLKIDTKANREYKNSVFTLLFGTRVEAARMFNTFFGTNYGPDDVELTTLVNVLYRGCINDLSFVVDGKLVVLIEHQSTINTNMAIRMFDYYAVHCSRSTSKENLYSRKKIKLPEPIFIVLYNGLEDIGDFMEMKLSDHFIKNSVLGGEPPMLDLTVKIYNINKGHNPHLAERNPTLDGYETFIDLVRKYEKTMTREEAIRKAVNECIEQNILKEFLTKHKPEVEKMLFREWKFEEEVAVVAREAAEEKSKNIARGLLKRGGISVDEIVSLTGLDLNTVLHLQGE